MDEHFKDWDSQRKYIKAPYQQNIARIGHLEYLRRDVLNEVSGLLSIYAMPVTLQEVQDLINNATLQANTFYELVVEGGQTIYLQSTSPSTLSNVGIGKFYNPKFNYAVASLGVWQGDLYDAGVIPFLSYSAGDKVVWGGRMWTSISGNYGVKISESELDPADWQLIAYNDTDYDVVYDEIEYDYENDLIVYRKDKVNNSVRISKTYLSSVPTNPIKVWQWGNANNENNFISHSLVDNQNTASYFKNSNFTGESIIQNNLFKTWNIANSTITSTSITGCIGIDPAIVNSEILNSKVENVLGQDSNSIYVNNVLDVYNSNIFQVYYTFGSPQQGELKLTSSFFNTVFFVICTLVEMTDANLNNIQVSNLSVALNNIFCGSGGSNEIDFISYIGAYSSIPNKEIVFNEFSTAKIKYYDSSFDVVLVNP